jgi:hypothetical protein
LATLSTTRRLVSERRKSGTTVLGVSPSQHESWRTPPSPSPRPAPGLRPVMKPSTEAARALKTLIMVFTYSLEDPMICSAWRSRRK